MNTLSTGVDDVVECPLCMEPLEVDDLNFYPCTCGYQICRFCWHRIRTDENELCPACRKEYPENPADFKPLTQEEMIAFKSQKRQRDQQRKQKITENRKHLANVRVVQKNLVFVVGLPPRLADADILKKHEYFGKYGKIHKVVINPSTTYAGIQGPSASAYVTYVHNTDALRAIQSVNNITIDGRLIKTSLGTTKYCSHFMKNQQCPKGDCMYLHELGDPEASFTKEEMHQGKHQEYEKRLHDALIATSGSGLGGSQVLNNSVNGNATQTIKIAENNRSNVVVSSVSLTFCGTSSSPPNATFSNSSTVISNVAIPPQKEAWPSLSVSPTITKECSSNVAVTYTNGNKNKKDRLKQEKAKNERIGKIKTKTNNNNNNNNNSSNGSIVNSLSKDHDHAVTVTGLTSYNNSSSDIGNKTKSEKKQQNGLSNRSASIRKEEDSTSYYSSEKKSKGLENTKNSPHKQNSESPKNVVPNKGNFSNAHIIQDKCDDQRSLASNSSGSNTNDTLTSTDDSNSGKSTPGDEFNEKQSVTEANTNNNNNTLHTQDNNLLNMKNDGRNLVGNSTCASPLLFPSQNMTNDDSSTAKQTAKGKNCIENEDKNEKRINSFGIEDTVSSTTLANDNKLNTAKNDFVMEDLAKLSLFDGNSFFTSVGALQDSLLMKNKLIDPEMSFSAQPNSVTNPHLPDLINGIDGYQNNITNINDWEEAFNNVLPKSGKLQYQQQQQQLLSHHAQHEKDIERLQEIQKRSGLLNSLGLAQLNRNHHDLQNMAGNEFGGHNNVNVNVNAQQQHMQNQLLLQQQNLNENCLQNTLFGTNMSKFFDFHKNQQQQKMQNCFNSPGSTSINNGSAVCVDNLHLLSYLENNRGNSQLFDWCNQPTPQHQHQTQQQQLKQRYYGKMDQMLCHQQQQQQQQPQQSQQPLHGSLQTAQTGGPPLPNHFLQNTSSDDDLGFDPFVETQKALAELMENEEEQQNAAATSSSKILHHHQQQQQQQQQQHQTKPQINNQQHVMDYMQRARMPPPGFNHVNTFGGFGGPRAQGGSKIMPFMNLNTNTTGGHTNGHAIHQQQMPNNSWNAPLVGGFQQQNPPMGESQIRQMSTNQMQNNAPQKNFTGNDWTAMDPAILSFRQFSTFPHHSTMTPNMQQQHQQQQQQQQQQQDLFMQQMAQQQNSGFGGFNAQAQLLGGNNLPNSVLNPPQALQPHVNANVQGMLEYLKNRQFV